MTDTAASPAAASAPYRVLARKYRPVTFEGLIGQEAMVRVLSNAISSGRLAHAYLLTGVRGVGKTSTARIIARALNCIGLDGKGGPTTEPCGQCVHCQEIAADRHVDVIEMDAASHTGVDDVREIIDAARYRPISARYKVYIIDEVHMLSKPAFNALLKTLEEPPEHVKFIFATTEVRRVPVTVLSRCQRFDLKRVDMGRLAAHLADVAEKEGVRISDDALALLARAADGSVRDGLSLLEQAIAHAAGGKIEAEPVRDMLGLADRTRVFDLLEAFMKGDCPAALDLFQVLYDSGADPLMVIQDLMEAVNWVARIKAVPALKDSREVPEAERVRGAALAEALSMPVLTRAWQMLMKGLTEVQYAPNAAQAAEMVLIRLAYAADLPPPAELVAALSPGGSDTTAAPRSSSSAPSPRSAPGARRESISSSPNTVSSSASSSAVRRQSVEPAMVPDERGAEDDRPHASLQPIPQSFEQLVTLFRERRQMRLYVQLYANVHLVHFEAGRLEFNPTAQADPKLASQVSQLLKEWTGRRWIVSVTKEKPGAPTLKQQAEEADARARQEAASHPVVAAVLEKFRGAKVRRVRVDTPASTSMPTPTPTLPGASEPQEPQEDSGEES